MAQPRLLLLLTWFLVALPAATAVSQDHVPGPKRILVVYENENTLAAIRDIGGGLLAAFEERMPGDFEIYSEYMDANRFPTAADAKRFKENLVAKYENLSLDVLIAVGPNALQFVLDSRDDIALGAPIVFGAVGEKTARAAESYADVGGVVSHFDVGETIALARQIQPEATRIVVMTGSAEFDRSWEATAKQELQAFEPEMDIEYVSGLTLDGFKSAAGKLPADAILLLLTIFTDAAGQQFVPRDATAEIVPASGAPAYGVYSTWIGTGIVGGFMDTFESIGRDTATLAMHVMLGEVSTAKIVHSTGRPIVDWRQLRRWGFDEANLPPDTELLFYEPTPFERYRWQILAALAVILLQTATIVALVFVDRRRRKIEGQLAFERLELARLGRVSRLGELSGALAHELRQPLASILANAETGARLLNKNPPEMGEIREILRDIISDNERAATVITHVRQMMSKQEIELEPVDLNRAVVATLALSKSEFLARQTQVDFRRWQSDLTVRGDNTQLQQIVLNLMLNAADAMADMPPAERHIVVETRLRQDGFREVSVADRGPGLSPEIKADAFKPFVTSKASGMGLGLAICHSIAEAHGGSLAFEENRSRGARVVLTLPPP